MLDIYELSEIEDEVRENLENIMTTLNRNGKLEEFLELLGMQSLLNNNTSSYYHRQGKIIVIGQSEVNSDKLMAIAKSMGIEKDRIEFYLDYEDAVNFDFKKTQWSDKYSCILVGPMPHSGYSKADYSSVITALEKQEGYPPVVRIGSSGLKITKTSFRQSLQFAMDEKLTA